MHFAHDTDSVRSAHFTGYSKYGPYGGGIASDSEETVPMGCLNSRAEGSVLGSNSIVRSRFSMTRIVIRRGGMACHLKVNIRHANMETLAHEPATGQA